MVKVENGFMYFLSRKSSISRNDYVFTKQTISDMASTTVYGTIYVPNTEFYGFCLRNANLDYLVGLNTQINEIRIITLKFNAIKSRYELNHYKTVAKDVNVTEPMAVDCQWVDEGYKIGISATYYDASINDFGYYVSLFDTRANYTIWHHS